MSLSSGPRPLLDMFGPGGLFDGTAGKSGTSGRFKLSRSGRPEPGGVVRLGAGCGFVSPCHLMTAFR